MRTKGFWIAVCLLICCAGCGRKEQEGAGKTEYVTERQAKTESELQETGEVKMPENGDITVQGNGAAGFPENAGAELLLNGEAQKNRTPEAVVPPPGKDKTVQELGEDKTAQKSGENRPVQESGQLDVSQWLDKLTLEEKVAQMFIVLPESFMGVGEVTAAGDTTRSMLRQFPVGGFIYMEPNLISAGQIKEMLSGVQAISMERIGLPALCCVDEEGGTVARIGGRGIVDAPYVGNMSEIGASGDSAQAYQAGVTIGSYLSELGFNVDFAPVADVLSNPANTVVRERSFGSDPELVSEMVLSELEGLETMKVCGTLKHFPGHGATEGDTHAGYAYTSKPLEELRQCELLPFQRGIDAGVKIIMVGHISVPGVTGEDTPASLSRTMITEILRNQMGYDGLVVTDAMNMGAISQMYSSAEAAVRTVQAGADLILMPADFQSAYYGVLDAVASGTVSEERINESVERILKLKLDMIK
ncbi:MAG: glycoside hydrolase family 3 protein [Lachnospiraceae bacterium]|nr:glycoside hydrolase family 3 protein [Lachnospiraceae bacterium]